MDALKSVMRWLTGKMAIVKGQYFHNTFPDHNFNCFASRTSLAGIALGCDVLCPGVVRLMR